MPGRRLCPLAVPCALLLAALLRPAALAQPPHADWRTVETGHFRVHYPAPSEAWALAAAARLEAIRERVVAEVGYAPPEVVDVLVSDPVAEPNGAALPFLGWPRMLLWTSPPGPESVIGHYRSWAEILTVHEEAHLVHMLRPSRNPLQRALAALLPAGPITLESPRWVIEGYATVVEGRLTASGRPNGDLRAAIIRRWAQAGKLPSYGRLASDSESWQGMSMAYLVGSAYLEWLEERAGPGSLRNLWARMTARRDRDFEEAFAGVFGDSPADLYDRFRAEVTGRALEAEQRVEAAGLREGELWQDLSWTTGAPAVSRDGERLTIVLRRKDRPSRLVVLSTAPDEEAETKWQEERDRIAARDPEDVPAVRTHPIARKRLHELPPVAGAEPTMPRFLPDGSVLFVRFEPDADGFLHPDLFRWRPQGESGGPVERLTWRADLRDPDPAPDGTWAVSVRNRHGLSQIVRVDLGTGEVAPVTEASVEVVYDQPRVAPDSRRIAVAEHREGSWRLVVREVGGGEARDLPLPAGATVAAPAWSADGATVYAVIGLGGTIEVWSFPADRDGGEPSPVTRTHGAAMAPEPAPDGGLFYLSLEPDGFDLARLAPPEGDAARLTPFALPIELAPVARPALPPAPEPFAVAELPPARPYGLGRQEWAVVSGGSAGSAGDSLELGLRAGDVVGRFDTLALGGYSGSGAPEGGALAVAWRGWPVALSFHLFDVEERPSEQSGTVSAPARLLDAGRRGAELRAEWDRRWRAGGLSVAAGGLWSRVDPEVAAGLASEPGEPFDQAMGFATVAESGAARFGRWRLEQSARVHAQIAESDGGGWERAGGAVTLGVARDDSRLAATYRRDSSSGDLRFGDLFQLGGAASSLLPRSALANRIVVPALPAGTLLGEDYEGWRAELDGLLPAQLFWESHRLWSSGLKSTDWFTLAGLEWRFETPPVPLARLPALDLRVGVAQTFDEPFEDETRWWVSVVARP